MTEIIVIFRNFVKASKTIGQHKPT